jgi:glycosyltransferase involved in cell wall biosynthesis
MSRPLVSVVIPYLDPDLDHLREAVGSVVAQDYRPLELILVNDGSHPSTVAYARSLAEDTEIPARCLEHPGAVNRGSSATRNLGASVAGGEFLAFLDADDTWAPGKVTEQVAIMQRDPGLALVFGPSLYWYSWSASARGLHEDHTPQRGIEPARVIQPPKFVADFLRGRVINPSPTNFMVRRDAFLVVGGFEEDFRGLYDDQAFLLKLGLRHAVFVATQCWDHYRQHPDSMTARAESAGVEEEARCSFLAWARSYCSAQGIRSPEVWEAIHKEIWLAGSRPPGKRRAGRRLRRRLKKWWLRFDDRVLTAGLRHRLWGGPPSFPAA